MKSTPASNNSLENTKDMKELTEALKGKIEAEALRRFPEKHNDLEDSYQGDFRADYMSNLTKGAELALESAWVDIKERHPPADTLVLIYGSKGYGTSSHSGYGMPVYVTHWQPLPSPPNTTP